MSRCHSCLLFKPLYWAFNVRFGVTQTQASKRSQAVVSTANCSPSFPQLCMFRTFHMCWWTNSNFYPTLQASPDNLFSSFSGPHGALVPAHACTLSSHGTVCDCRLNSHPDGCIPPTQPRVWVHTGVFCFALNGVLMYSSSHLILD